MQTIKLFLITLLLCFTSIYNAQTKQETIDWLKDKLGNYMVGGSNLFKNVKLIKLNECEIVFESTFNKEATWRFEMPTGDMTVEKNGYLGYKVKAVKIITPTWVDFENSSYKIRIEDREENIYERVQKAIQHLATFCPKKTEIF